MSAKEFLGIVLLAIATSTILMGLIVMLGMDCAQP